MEAFCMKCRTKRDIQDPAQITMKNGRPATPRYLWHLRDQAIQNRQELGGSGPPGSVPGPGAYPYSHAP